MSWSVQRVGTKEAVAEAVTADFDRCMKNYEGQEEARDVLAAKERALAAIAGIDVREDALSKAYGVHVTASGSASKYSTNISVNVARIALSI